MTRNIEFVKMYVKTKEAAEILGLAESTVRGLVGKGILRTDENWSWHGHRILIEDVLKYKETNRKPGPKPKTDT